MIDRADEAKALMARLTEHLPIRAELTPEAVASLRADGLDAAPSCVVTGLTYAGDEGGIMCELDPETYPGHDVLVSITQVRFGTEVPLHDEIVAYQDHRSAGIAQLHSDLAALVPAPLPLRIFTVPEGFQARFDEVTALTDAFCLCYLDDEYLDLARDMTATLCSRVPSPIAAGAAKPWACAIIHALGRINRLSDPSSQPYMTTAQVCTAFGVSAVNAGAKARLLMDALETHQLDPRWARGSLIHDTVLELMAMVEGRLSQPGELPPIVQEMALRMGLSAAA